MDHLQKFLDYKNNYKIIPWRKVVRAEWCKKLQFLLRRGLKLPHKKKKVDLVVWSLQRNLLCKVAELAE